MKENPVCGNVESIHSAKEVEQLLVVERREQYLGGGSLLRCNPMPPVSGKCVNGPPHKACCVYIVFCLNLQALYKHIM